MFQVNGKRCYMSEEYLKPLFISVFIFMAKGKTRRQENEKDRTVKPCLRLRGPDFGRLTFWRAEGFPLNIIVFLVIALSGPLFKGSLTLWRHRVGIINKRLRWTCQAASTSELSHLLFNPPGAPVCRQLMLWFRQIQLIKTTPPFLLLDLSFLHQAFQSSDIIFP